MKEKKILLIGFLTILFSFFTLYPVNYLLSKFEIINIISYSSETASHKDGGLLSNISNKLEDIKVKIKNRTTDYFPGYSLLNSIDKGISRNEDRKIYNNVLNYQYYPTGKNSDGEYIFTNDVHYFLENSMPSTELDKRIEEQINFFNSLDIDNLNLFIPYRFEYLNLYDSNQYRNLSKYINIFKNSITSNINIGELYVNSIDDYLKYFYKTDHHYNAYGAYESYKAIMYLLGEDPINVSIKKENIAYYGSIARSSFSTKVKDSFYTLQADLNEHDILVNGKENKEYKPKTITTKKGTFHDYYVEYYYGLYGNVCFDYHDERKDNLLILEDSYGWQIDEIIAANFNKTYVIDIRHDEYENGTFNIKQFMKDNDIDKVLFLYEAGTVFFDQYNYGLKDKVIS